MMTDRKMIERYLNRYYTIVTDPIVYHNFDVTIENKDLVESKFDDYPHTISSLKCEITRTFTNFKTEENLLVSEIVEEWFKRNVEEFYKPIFKILKTVEVTFGKTSWEIKKKRKKIQRKKSRRRIIKRL